MASRVGSSITFDMASGLIYADELFGEDEFNSKSAYDPYLPTRPLTGARGYFHRIYCSELGTRQMQRLLVPMDAKGHI